MQQAVAPWTDDEGPIRSVGEGRQCKRSHDQSIRQASRMAGELGILSRAHEPEDGHDVASGESCPREEGKVHHGSSKTITMPNASAEIQTPLK